MQNTEAWLLHRKVYLKNSLSLEQQKEVRNHIDSLEGIKSVSFLQNHTQVDVVYDASFVSYKQILNIFINDKIAVRKSIWQNVKTNWYAYIDNNIKINANTPPSACCNKVPKIK